MPEQLECKGCLDLQAVMIISYYKVDKPLSEGTIKSQVFLLLDENLPYSAKKICALLNIDYKHYQNYVYVLRSKWKTLSKNEHGSNCSSMHGWRGWTYLFDRERSRVMGLMDACREAGWLGTRARNRWIFWKDKLGRLQLFETGRIDIYVCAPINPGRIKQLVCNGFSFTGVIKDDEVIGSILRDIRFQSAHYVFEAGQPLPKLTIDCFSKSNGVDIKVGDRSHPNAVEVIASCPDWAERNEKLLERLIETVENRLIPEKDHASKPAGRLSYIG
ncbi:MAG: hypothetical protein V1850_01970 [Candidatus Bathyarchaeota archaeon]